MPSWSPATLHGRELGPHKAIVAPLLGRRNVLTNSPWTYVHMWLTRERKSKALFYWQQSEEFFKASNSLSIRSAPLLLYYSFMNAAKALLASKGLPFIPYHGVTAYDARGPNAKVLLANEGVEIKNNGVLPALSGYYGETETSKKHVVKDMLFNLAYVHRTYCLSYESQSEMFIPLTRATYVVDHQASTLYFLASVSKNVSPRWLGKHLPATFAIDERRPELRIRSTATVPWTKKTPDAMQLQALMSLHKALRADLQYINGAQTLWYAKCDVAGAKRLSRQPTTLTLATMHRLSELCRYRPFELESLLAGRTNWLLSEFIQQSPAQFIDEMAAEITGSQFLTPNVRTPS